MVIIKANKSGYRGVFWDKKSRRWCSKIRAFGKSNHLGYFDDVIEGAKAYDNFAIIHNLRHTRNFNG